MLVAWHPSHSRVTIPFIRRQPLGRAGEIPRDPISAGCRGNARIRSSHSINASVPEFAFLAPQNSKGTAIKNRGRPISPGSDGRALYARPVRYAPWLRPCHTFYRDGSAFGWQYQWRGGTNRPGVTTTAISLAPSPYGYRSNGAPVWVSAKTTASASR